MSDDSVRRKLMIADRIVKITDEHRLLIDGKDVSDVYAGRDTTPDFFEELREDILEGKVP